MKRFLFIIIILVVLIAAPFVYYKFNDENKSDAGPSNSKNNRSQNNSTEPEGKKPKSVTELTASAWVPYWDFSRGIDTLKANPGKFDSISPVIYEVNEDGSLKKTKGDSYKDLQEYAQSNDIEFIPSIAMFDHEIFTKVLQEEEHMNLHVNSIIDQIEENDFDGIDLDYESTKLDDKEEYEEFIKELSKRCKEIDVKLTITVLAKWAPDLIYPSLNETRKVQDWEFLSEYADEIRIMAYDYTSQYSQEPGPIAPLPWIELILKKAVNEIPREKIVLGVHNYGYNWAAENIDPDINFETNPPTEKLKADAYTYDQILSIKEKYSGQTEENLLWGENYYVYERDGKSRVLIYIDQKGISERRSLAAEYGIKGVSFWRLGGDSKFEY